MEEAWSASYGVRILVLWGTADSAKRVQSLNNCQGPLLVVCGELSAYL